MPIAVIATHRCHLAFHTCSWHCLTITVFTSVRIMLHFSKVSYSPKCVYKPKVLAYYQHYHDCNPVNSCADTRINQDQQYPLVVVIYLKLEQTTKHNSLATVYSIGETPIQNIT